MRPASKQKLPLARDELRARRFDQKGPGAKKRFGAPRANHGHGEIMASPEMTETSRSRFDHSFRVLSVVALANAATAVRQRLDQANQQITRAHHRPGRSRKQR